MPGQALPIAMGRADERGDPIMSTATTCENPACACDPCTCVNRKLTLNSDLRLTVTYDGRIANSPPRSDVHSVRSCRRSGDGRATRPGSGQRLSVDAPADRQRVPRTHVLSLTSSLPGREVALPQVQRPPIVGDLQHAAGPLGRA